MKLEYAVRLWAGILVLTGLLLGYAVSPWWYLLTAFVGLNLVQSAFTGFCPAEIILKKLGVGKSEKREGSIPGGVAKGAV